MIIVAVASPGARWYVADLHKLPVGYIGWRQTQIIAHCRRDIQAGTVIKVRLWSLIPENVLKMVGPERPAIFPLRIADAIAHANRNPPMTKGVLSQAGITLIKQREYEW